MSYTSADLAAVRSTRLRGERSVQFGDRNVTYKSDDELRQLESEIIADLNRQAATPRHRQFLGSASKGL